MSATDDTARRERAEKLRERAMDWLEARVARGPQACEVYDFETFAIGYSDHRDLARLVGFCAGAREEAAIQVAEIAALRERIKALEGLISGAIQHSWTSEDYDKFWLAVGKEKP